MLCKVHNIIGKHSELNINSLFLFLDSLIIINYKYYKMTRFINIIYKLKGYLITILYIIDWA